MKWTEDSHWGFRFIAEKVMILQVEVCVWLFEYSISDMTVIPDQEDTQDEDMTIQMAQATK